MVADFVHLRVQSSYSMLESSIKIEEIANLTAKYHMPAVALTDKNNLFAALEFALYASKNGIQPINGIILNLACGDKGNEIVGQILLLAKDEVGYKNLLRLGSQIYIVKNPICSLSITIDDLKQYNQGLIALSGYTEGIIGKLLLENKSNEAQQHLKLMKEIFSNDRFYLEIMRHGLAAEQNIEDDYIELATKTDTPLVATNNVLFSNAKMYDPHDTLLCIAEGTIKEAGNRRTVSNQCYFKSPKEMKELFKDLPCAIENTIKLASRCYVMAETNQPMLPSFAKDGTSEEEEFRQKAKGGLDLRLKQKFELERKTINITEENIATIREQYEARLNYELDVICSMKFAGYFLIVSDFIKWSKDNKIPVGPGRGSGAGSIVAWSLLITDLDPIRFGLLFERFLNPERVSMPDFDIDFCQERREEVISYVCRKYGSERVAQIITFGKLQAKAVIKDVARALTLPYHLADRISKLVPFNAINPVTLEQAIDDVAELKEASKGNGLYNADLNQDDKELIKSVIDTALKLEGLHRHASIHAAGIVISGKDLIEVVPLYREENSSMFVIQYSMKYAELAGLVKFDFLGLKTLTVIDKCCNLVKSQGMEVSLNAIEFGDLKTYELLSSGLATGVFQFESPGMKESLRKLKPDSIEDIMALGALYRPGPMDNIPTYIACKHGKQQPDYLHPLLQGILKETYGVIIYQEQVIEIAKTLSGYSLGAADLLRRAMGKKIKAEMDAQQQLFIEGAKANGVDPAQAQQIFAAVEKFAGYGFNKSHAAAYAVISYHTAYLKANFPVEFLCASLNLEIHDSNKINIFIQEAKKMGIPVLAPDVNSSNSLYSIAKDKDGNKALVFALGGLKNISPDAGAAIAEVRETSGAFKNIFDFVERIPEKEVNRRVLENLIKSGAFDKLHPNRNQLFSAVNTIIEYAQRYHRDKITNQMNLFDAMSKISKYPELPEVDDFSLDEKAFKEYEAIGFFFSNHPLDNYVQVLEKNNIINSAYLFGDLPLGTHNLRIAGVIHEKDAKMSPRGRFIILQLSDQYGMYDATIFNEDVLKRCAPLLEGRIPIVLNCEIRKDEGGIRLAVQNIEDIEKIAYKNRSEYKITLNSNSKMEELLTNLNKLMASNGNTEISLIFDIDNSFIAKSKLPGKFLMLPKDIEAIKDKRVEIEEIIS
ncbi:MAG: dnaE1 [Rickettsiaceae bacterium]|nr:dnaE1 [Rickettsiaceae bacterium]